MNELIEGVKAGRRRAIAQLITLVENDEKDARHAVSQLYMHTGNSHIVGVTGPPGSGKSTLVNEIAKEIRQRQRNVGIVAVDPSSPFSGGALLGDRVRMRDLSGDAGIFIRSMASRGSLGGLAKTTADVVKILDAAKYDTILVETVGAGQAEVDIASAAHTTLVIETPGMGDEIQSIKAGILEVADILIVNKVDRPGAEMVLRVLKGMLSMGSGRPPTSFVQHHDEVLAVDSSGSANLDDPPRWEVPIFKTVATEGQGIDELVDCIEEHRRHLKASGEWERRELARSRSEVIQLLQLRFLQQLSLTVSRNERDRLIEAVARREIDPYTAVDQLYQLASD